MVDESHNIIRLIQLESLLDESTIILECDEEYINNVKDIFPEKYSNLFFLGKDSNKLTANNFNQILFLKLIASARDLGWKVLTSHCRNTNENYIERTFYLEKLIMKSSSSTIYSSALTKSALINTDSNIPNKTSIQPASNSLKLGKPEDVSNLPSWRIALDLANKRKQLTSNSVPSTITSNSNSTGNGSNKSYSSPINSYSFNNIKNQDNQKLSNLKNSLNNNNPVSSSTILSILNNRKPNVKDQDITNSQNKLEIMESSVESSVNLTDSNLNDVKRKTELTNSFSREQYFDAKPNEEVSRLRSDIGNSINTDKAVASKPNEEVSRLRSDIGNSAYLDKISTPISSRVPYVYSLKEESNISNSNLFTINSPQSSTLYNSSNDKSNTNEINQNVPDSSSDFVSKNKNNPHILPYPDSQSKDVNDIKSKNAEYFKKLRDVFKRIIIIIIIIISCCIIIFN